MSGLGLTETRVDVYRNLNDDSLTVLLREPDSASYGRKVGSADRILIDEPEFVVQDAGRERVRDEEQKNVHAFVRGSVEKTGLDAELEWDMLRGITKNDYVQASYDPYEMERFEVTDVIRMNEREMQVGDPVRRALYAYVTIDDMFVMFPSRD